MNTNQAQPQGLNSRDIVRLEQTITDNTNPHVYKIKQCLASQTDYYLWLLSQSPSNKVRKRIPKILDTIVWQSVEVEKLFRRHESKLTPEQKQQSQMFSKQLREQLNQEVQTQRQQGQQTVGGYSFNSGQQFPNFQSHPQMAGQS